MNNVNLNIELASFNKIIDFFFEQELDKVDSIADFKQAASLFISLNPDIEVESFEAFSAYDLPPVIEQEYKTFAGEEGLLRSIKLDNFLTILRITLNGGNAVLTMDHNDMGAIRQASPPLEAYTYNGHNALNITPTNSSYALNFEKY